MDEWKSRKENICFFTKEVGKKEKSDNWFSWKNTGRVHPELADVGFRITKEMNTGQQKFFQE